MSNNIHRSIFHGWHRAVLDIILGVAAILWAIPELIDAMQRLRETVCRVYGPDVTLCHTLSYLVWTPPPPVKIQPDAQRPDMPATPDVHQIPKVASAWEKKLPPKPERASWDGRVIACAVDTNFALSVDRYLYDLGFTNLRPIINTVSRENWIAYNSSVFFYDIKAKSTVEAIGEILHEHFDISFNITNGAGLGVSQDLREKTFFVHLISDSCPKEPQ